MLLHLVFYNPEIPLNTGGAIRLCAVTGCHLHLIRPLGFRMDDAHLRRAGLDYHDLADVSVHEDLDSALAGLLPAPLLAFTTKGELAYTAVDYTPGAVLLFGPESSGLPDHVLADPRVTARVRVPMRPARRSLNLANTAAVAVYEAWRQQGFPGGS